MHAPELQQSDTPAFRGGMCSIQVEIAERLAGRRVFRLLQRLGKLLVEEIFLVLLRIH